MGRAGSGRGERWSGPGHCVRVQQKPPPARPLRGARHHAVVVRRVVRVALNSGLAREVSKVEAVLPPPVTGARHSTRGRGNPAVPAFVVVTQVWKHWGNDTHLLKRTQHVPHGLGRGRVPACRVAPARGRGQHISRACPLAYSTGPRILFVEPRTGQRRDARPHSWWLIQSANAGDAQARPLTSCGENAFAGYLQMCRGKSWQRASRLGGPWCQGC